MNKYKKALIVCNKLTLDCVLGNTAVYQPNLILAFLGFFFFPTSNELFFLSVDDKSHRGCSHV